MPHWGDRDARRRTCRGPMRAGARRRRLAPAPEGLEGRALLAQFVPGEVLVQYAPDAGEVARGRARGRAGAVLEERIETGPMRDAGRGALERVALPAGLSVPDAMRALRADPAVLYAEPNWIYTHTATSDDPYYTNGSLWGMYGDDAAVSPSVGPNAYGSQAEEAWAAGQTGSQGVYVGVIDEGIQFDHPDLINNAWTNPYDPVDGIDNDGNGYADDVRGWDFVSNNNTVYDGGKRGSADEHGTHVAGTIGAQGGNGTGVAGVNWNVTYISGKFLGSNGGTTANAIKAVDYFTDLKVRHGLNIVATNNSWGGGGFSQGLLDAITRAAKENILFIAAAGNNSSNNDGSASYPSNYDTTAGAGYDAVIAVAALNSDGSLASYSNFGGTTVDLAAPGSGISSTLPYNGYGSYSGTSMATPHVTGAAALYAAANPGATAAQIRQALLGSVVPTDSVAGKTVTGGRLDVAAALSFTPATAPPAAPSGLTAAAVSSSQVDLGWTDNSTDESGFKVEVSTDGFATVARVDLVAAGATAYRVSGLNAATPYSFRVRATNARGDSDASNVASATTPAATAAVLFGDDFNSGAARPEWRFSNGTWGVSGGVLSQTDTADAPEKKAIVTGLGQTATQITARVRVDSWQDGEYARAGVSLMTDSDGRGYGFVFSGRNRTGTNKLEFVNDGVAWSGWDSQAGAAGILNFSWNVGTWYWFKMKVENNVLSGKVWADGSPEPDGWLLVFDGKKFSGWTRTAGDAGLNGSAAGRLSRKEARSYATASFDDVTVETTVAAAPSGSTTSVAGAFGLVVPIEPKAPPAPRSQDVILAIVEVPASPLDEELLGDLGRDVLRSRRRR